MRRNVFKVWDSVDVVLVHLLLHQSGVGAIGSHQLGVRPDFYGLPFIQNQDAVGVDNARQTMSDHERRPIFHQSVERFLYH